MSKKEMANPRDAYGETLVKLGGKYPNIVVLDADLSKSTKTILFAKKYPERFFEMGIAEANMISVAAGLASCGKIPFASTFAVFATGRVYDQIRIDVAYSDFIRSSDQSGNVGVHEAQADDGHRETGPSQGASYDLRFRLRPVRPGQQRRRQLGQQSRRSGPLPRSGEKFSATVFNIHGPSYRI